MTLNDYDIIIVGCGLSGIVIAERFALLQNKKILIIDKRDHIGGNCYDYFDEETNILMNKYGAHLFHTNDEEVFSYIKQFWNPTLLNKAVASVGMNITTFGKATENAIPFTMDLCEKVMANCFKNTTYTPTRKGSCPGKIALFHYLGFDRENLKRHNIVKYPF